MNHGCQALGEVPERFGDDEEVRTAFIGFQQACQLSLQQAMAKAGAGGGKAKGKKKGQAVEVQ